MQAWILAWVRARAAADSVEFRPWFYSPHGVRTIFLAWAALLLLVGSRAAVGAAATPEPARLAPPVFSRTGGVFSNNVILSMAAPKGTVHYTLDGGDPDENSPMFTAAILITNCLTVRARAWVAGESPSRVASESFFILDDDVVAFGSDLPIVMASTGGAEFTTQNKLPISLRCQPAAPGRRATLLAAPDYEGRAIAGIRGRSSRFLPKHSFNLKLVEDGSDDKRKAPVLGLPQESDWVLYAPYSDKTLMRDVLAYELSNDMGRYAPRTRLVEVFLNTGGTRLRRADYAGVYVFEERITRDKARLNLAALSPTDRAQPELSGGYIFKKDHLGGGRADRNYAPPAEGRDGSVAGAEAHALAEPGGFPADLAGLTPPLAATGAVGNAGQAPPVLETPPAPLRRRVGDLWRPAGDRQMGRNLSDGIITAETGEIITRWEAAQLFLVHPDAEEITGMQRTWLKDYLDRFEAALHGPDFRDPAHGYAGYIDAGSFIDYHLLTEMVKNVDGFRFSTYFHKDRGGKIHMGPLWDMNLTFGNASGKEGYLPERWLWPQLNDREYSWFYRLFDDPDFAQSYVDRWAQLRTNVLRTARVLQRVDDYAALLHEAQPRNFARWPILGVNVSPNYFVGANYAEEVAWMKEWIARRLEWMDAQFLSVPVVWIQTGGAPAITFTNPAPGEILYTLQGADPRAPGGGVISAARRYETPVTLKGGERLFARRHLAHRWSAPSPPRAPPGVP